MLTKLREPFGKAGLIVAIVALIAALGGGAYAASGGLSGKQKKEVEKIAKKYAGKNGINGTSGAPGVKGDAGAAGSNGTNGTNGTPGGPGASVEEIPIATGEPTCEQRGGAEYLVEGAAGGTAVCNGKTGSPWAVGGLPKGATETGAWSFNAGLASADENGKVFVSFSLPVPLSTPITSSAQVHFTGFEGDTTCTGEATEPTAPEGMMCIYESEVAGASFLFATDLLGEQHIPNPSGGFLVFHLTEDNSYGRGSWAITSG